MKYLITGGSGFIGGHLVDLLIENNCELIVVDDLSFGKMTNIEHNFDKITFINDKIQNLSLDMFNDIDGIFHLAAQASVPLSIDKFYESSLNNLDSSLKVIDFARKLKIPLIYATSSAIYGNLPLGSDEIDKFDLESPYALDKLVLEQYAKVANRIYDMSSIGLRFFNVYGPRQDASNPYSGVISIFADRMLKKQSITVNGGYQTRDFIYVGDIVNTLYLSMIKASNQICYETINVGTGVSISINELVDILSNLINFKPEIEYKELPLGDPERSEGTYEKLNKNLKVDINQFLSLEEGLKPTIDFFQKELLNAKV